MLKWGNEDPEVLLEIPHFSSGESPVLVSLVFLQLPGEAGKNCSKSGLPAGKPVWPPGCLSLFCILSTLKCLCSYCWQTSWHLLSQVIFRGRQRKCRWGILPNQISICQNPESPPWQYQPGKSWSLNKSKNNLWGFPSPLWFLCFHTPCLRAAAEQEIHQRPSGLTWM